MTSCQRPHVLHPRSRRRASSWSSARRATSASPAKLTVTVDHFGCALPMSALSSVSSSFESFDRSSFMLPLTLTFDRSCQRSGCRRFRYSSAARQSSSIAFEMRATARISASALARATDCENCRNGSSPAAARGEPVVEGPLADPGGLGSDLRVVASADRADDPVRDGLVELRPSSHRRPAPPLATPVLPPACRAPAGHRFRPRRSRSGAAPGSGMLRAPAGLADGRFPLLHTLIVSREKRTLAGRA
jgi:hypothetical protein